MFGQKIVMLNLTGPLDKSTVGTDTGCTGNGMLLLEFVTA
jgi:hypothetical protein